MVSVTSIYGNNNIVVNNTASPVSEKKRGTKRKNEAAAIESLRKESTKALFNKFLPPKLATVHDGIIKNASEKHDALKQRMEDHGDMEATQRKAVSQLYTQSGKVLNQSKKDAKSSSEKFQTASQQNTTAEGNAIRALNYWDLSETSSWQTKAHHSIVEYCLVASKDSLRLVGGSELSAIQRTAITMQLKGLFTRAKSEQIRVEGDISKSQAGGLRMTPELAATHLKRNNARSTRASAVSVDKEWDA